MLMLMLMLTHFVDVYTRHVSETKETVVGETRLHPESPGVHDAFIGHDRCALMSMNDGDSFSYEDVTE